MRYRETDCRIHREKDIERGINFGKERQRYIESERQIHRQRQIDRERKIQKKDRWRYKYTDKLLAS